MSPEQALTILETAASGYKERDAHRDQIDEALRIVVEHGADPIAVREYRERYDHAIWDRPLYFLAHFAGVMRGSVAGLPNAAERLTPER